MELSKLLIPFTVGWDKTANHLYANLENRFHLPRPVPSCSLDPRSIFLRIKILSCSSVNIRWNILLTATTVNWTPLIVRFPIHEVNAEKRVRITNSRDYPRRSKRNEIEFIRWSREREINRGSLFKQNWDILYTVIYVYKIRMPEFTKPFRTCFWNDRLKRLTIFLRIF